MSDFSQRLHNIWHAAIDPLESADDSPAQRLSRAAPVALNTTDTIEIAIPASGREIFSPPLQAGRVYQLTLTGTFTYGWFFYRQADAGYSQDDYGNFVIPHDGLIVDSVACRTRQQFGNWHENRARHEYQMLIDGTGREISLRLIAPNGSRSESGGLHATLRLLPLGTQTVTQRYQAARQAEAVQQRQAEAEAAQLAGLQKQREDMAELLQQERAARQQAAEHQRQIQQQVTELRLAADRGRNLMNPQFRTAFIDQMGDKILQELDAKWTAERNAVVSSGALVEALRRDAPEVLAFLEVRQQIIITAERRQFETPRPKARKVHENSRSVDRIRRLIDELFKTDEEIDRLQRQSRSQEDHRHMIELLHQRKRTFEQLQTFGIDVETPEGAEAEFTKRYSTPTGKTFYEQELEHLERGEPASVHALFGRLKDLHHEERQRIRKRRNAIDRKHDADLKSQDEALMRIRQESTRITTALHAAHFDFSLSPEPKPDEPSAGERIVSSQEELNETLQRLREQGADDDTLEAVRTHYINQMSKFFGGGDDESYT